MQFFRRRGILLSHRSRGNMRLLVCAPISAPLWKVVWGARQPTFIAGIRFWLRTGPEQPVDDGQSGWPIQVRLHEGLAYQQQTESAERYATCFIDRAGLSAVHRGSLFSRRLASPPELDAESGTAVRNVNRSF